MQRGIVLRRGRCGRVFTKYVQKSIFEDSEASENEEDLKNIALKKRRRKYQDLFEYLRLDSRIPTDGRMNIDYQGLLLRDQKYLRKNIKKICQLSVKETAMKLIKGNAEPRLYSTLSGISPDIQPALKLDY